MTSKSIEQRHVRGQIPLSEYFKSEDDMAIAFAGVRFEVARAFLRATHPKTGRATGRDNYICGLDDSISALSKFVLDHTSLRRVFGHADLPKHTVHLTRVQWGRILDRIHMQMVSVVLTSMRDNEKNLWRLDGDWCFSNFIRVEYDRVMKEVKLAYRDSRNWHGRPSEQGRRRAKQLRVAPGVSIGS